jgi:hypothetical protein
MVLVIAAVCLAALCFNGLGASTPAAAVKAPSNASAPMNITSTANLLISDSGTNLSIMNSTLTYPSFFGLQAFGIGQTVKFTPPKAGWKLERVVIYGSDGWNSSQNTTPIQGIFALEIRDAKLNLLHHYSDTQLAYFTSANGVRAALIDVPAITMNGDFYVCFYGGGLVSTVTELNKATGKSYYYVRDTGQLLPGALPLKNNTTLPVNWIIRAMGE